jgi:aspartyl-tRNA(Asn)/glutamyl-tRNA(Gln) amidotransferase subunit A
MSLAQLATRLRAGELSPREATQSYLDRIEKLNPTVNAYLQVEGEQALAAADALERVPAAERGPLWGVPLGIKDVVDVGGMRTTAASEILRHNEVAEDSTAVARLRAAGAVILGKINTHEFALGAWTTSPHFGPARNPWDTDRICGGSSGGSGCAMAADLAAGTLGTDTAGSIRIPACFGGVTGIRPSTGRVPNTGSVPVSATFDTIGPIARTVEDCAIMLREIAGVDPRDPSTFDLPVPDYVAGLAGGIKGLRVGVMAARFESGIDPAVAATVREAVAELEALGAIVEQVRPAFTETAGVVHQLVMLPEAAQNHQQWLRDCPELYGADVRARLLAGVFLPGPAYVTGQKARRVAFDEARELFRRFDVIVQPQMPVVPPKIGQDLVDLGSEQKTYRLALLPFNSPWSLIGLPAMSVPAGFVGGLPVGMTIVGPRFGEETVFRAGHAFQQVTDWHERRPVLAG